MAYQGYRTANTSAYRRTVRLLVEHQVSQPEGCPYIFVPRARYERIQEYRRAGQWNVEKGRSPLSKFCHHFNRIRSLARIRTGTFHDLRRTCLSNWIVQGLSLHEVKELAGHKDITTTQRYAHLNRGKLKSAVEILEKIT